MKEGSSVCDQSKDALLHVAKMIVEEARIIKTEDPTIFVITLPNNPLPISCRINWNEKFHLCTCDNQVRPCSHLVACLYYAGTIKEMEDALLIKKTNFKAKYRTVKGSEKIPHSNYFKNPGIENIEPPKEGNDHIGVFKEVFNSESSKSDIHLLPGIAHDQITPQITHLNQLDKSTKDQRMPKYLLEHIHHLEQNEIFEICNTQNFGHVIFYSPKPHHIDVMAEKPATFQLVSYAAELIKHNCTSNQEEITVTVRVVENLSKTCVKLIIQDHPSENFVTYRTIFGSCCLKPVNLEEEKEFRCCKCKKIFHEGCVRNRKSVTKFTCSVCNTPTKGIQWSAGISMSCPLDSALQIILICCLDDSLLKSAILKTTYQNPNIKKAFKDCFHLSNQSKWEELHKTWAKAIGNTTNNLFGTTNDAFWKHAKEGGTFVKEYFCTNCKFLKQISSHQIQFVSALMSAMDNVDCLFQKEEGINLGSCGRCNKGSRISSIYKPDTEQTWFCLIEKDLMPHTMEECLQIQKRIKMGKYNFRLAGFIVSNPAEGKMTSIFYLY